MNTKRRSMRHWPLGLCAGLIPGAFLALGLMIMAGFACDAQGDPFSVTGQSLTWLAGLLWVAVLNVSLLFRTARGAWVWIGASALVVCAADLLVHHFRNGGAG